MKLTDSEKTWLVVNLKKMANNFLNTDDKTRLKIASDALSVVQEGKAPSRNVLRMLQQLCKKQGEVLTMRTIPAYQKRMTNPEKEKFYKSYLTSAQEAANMIQDILDKVESEL